MVFGGRWRVAVAVAHAHAAHTRAAGWGHGRCAASILNVWSVGLLDEEPRRRVLSPARACARVVALCERGCVVCERERKWGRRKVARSERRREASRGRGAGGFGWGWEERLRRRGAGARGECIPLGVGLFSLPPVAPCRSGPPESESEREGRAGWQQMRHPGRETITSSRFAISSEYIDQGGV